MTSKINICKEWFGLAYEGKKLFDVAIYTGDAQFFRDNDTIEIHDEMSKDYFVAILTRVAYFNSLENVFDMYSYKDFIPHAFSKKHAIMLYEEKDKFKAGELSYGLVAFRLTRVSNII